MEVTGVVFRQSQCFSPTTAESRHSQSIPGMKKPNSLRPKPQTIRKSFVGCVVSDEFSDKSHLQYYYGPRMAVDEIGSKKKEMKKKLKLLKGLSKNLSTFSEMGFYLNPDDNGLGQQVKGQMISEATELLVGQLQKLKEEKMESKKMKKAKKKMTTECKDSSSSSSESSSSESDCDNDSVVNMNQLKTLATSTSTSTADNLENPENRVTENAISKVASIINEDNSKKIEVCMGGKCKKSGAAMLMANFQAAVAGEAEVVGCKCMGKCRDGPNVIVRHQEIEMANSLCIGVGLEDVDRIVTNFFGGNQRSCSDMLPAFSSS